MNLIFTNHNIQHLFNTPIQIRTVQSNCFIIKLTKKKISRCKFYFSKMFFLLLKWTVSISKHFFNSMREGLHGNNSLNEKDLTS